MTAVQPERWLIREPTVAGSARLFCFPPAGVGASAFRRWPRHVGRLEVCPVQLPGRENRIRERPYREFEEFAAGAASGLRPYFDRPFAFFGHCMGAILVHTLLARLHDQGDPVPFRLYVSSSLAPHLGFFGPFHPSMSDARLADGLRNNVRALGEEQPIPELIELSVRILRNDVEMFYRRRPPAPRRLPCPVSTIAWSDDPNVRPEQMAGWRECGEVTQHSLLAGDNLTFLTAPSPLLAAIELDSRPAAASANWKTG